MSYEIHLCDSFKRAVKHLKRRYPNVTNDVSSAIRELQESPTKGDIVRGAKGVRKVRVENSDLNKGKSGSYRLLYYLVDRPSKRIYLIILFAKNERENISSKEILDLMRNAGLL
jgi:mRNA-degrading endonuclease RelE of RelBE toxin-antitoxin system